MKTRARLLLLAFLFLIAGPYAYAQPAYPRPLYDHILTIEAQQVRMAWMDARPQRPNGQTVLLLHGKNFNGIYWSTVIDFLNAAGYRVVVPDQPGFGRSDKPNIHYSLHQLAAGTRHLLDSLRIERVSVIGHSMGGMLAVRFALMYPQRVHRLILENPIGLEDYRTFVPWQPLDSLLAGERRATYASLKQYQQSYYPEWKPQYEALVAAQAEAMQHPDPESAARASALTYQMIYEQPIVYELEHITAKTLLIIGQEDRTIVGKARVPKRLWDKYGQYPQLGKQARKRIPGSRLERLHGVGHIPHIQSPEIFKKLVLGFLAD